MNKKKINLFLLSFCFMLISIVAYSQVIPPPPGELPIDGGLSFLLVSGVAYGIYTLNRKKE
jgi:hypothetical protein